MGRSLKQVVLRRLCVAVEMIMLFECWFSLLFMGQLHLSDMQNRSRREY